MKSSFKPVRLTLVFGLVLSLGQFVQGQDGGTVIPGVPTTPVVQQPTTPTTTTNNAGSLNEGQDVDLNNLTGLGGEITDNRNQGFVGSTAENVNELGFVGAASENSGPALSTGTTEGGTTTEGNINSFGGGINSGFTPAVGSGGGGFGRTGGFGGFGGAGGFGGSSTGFTVSRRPTPIRARLQPQFSFPTITASQTVNRFNNSFYSQPNVANLNGAFEISINNKTATVRGNVASQQDADRIVRQLRLQPGVYRIDNQLNVSQ